MHSQTFTTALLYTFMSFLDSTVDASALSIGVIADLHLNMFYVATSSENKCKNDLAPDNGSLLDSVDPYAPYGRFGCDTPPELAEVMF